MDPILRDQIESSELHTFWQWLKDWWGRHGTKVLVAVLVVLVAWYGWNWLASRAETARQEALKEFDQATSPDTCYAIAAKLSDKPVKQAEAYLKGADLALNRGNKPSGGGLEMSSGLDVQPEALGQAEEGYNKVVAIAAAPVEYKVNARKGLANIAEDRQQWDKARDLWTQAREEAAGAGLKLIADEAQARLDILGRIQQPVRFGTAPAPKLPEVPFSLSPPDYNRDGRQAATQPSATQPGGALRSGLGAPMPAPATQPSTRP